MTVPAEILNLARRLEGKGAVSGATAEQAAIASYHATLRDRTAGIRAELVSKLNAIAGTTPAVRAEALSKFDAEVARLAREPIAAFHAELRAKDAELARSQAALAAAESMNAKFIGIPEYLMRDNRG